MSWCMNITNNVMASDFFITNICHSWVYLYFNYVMTRDILIAQMMSWLGTF